MDQPVLKKEAVGSSEYVWTLLLGDEEVAEMKLVDQGDGIVYLDILSTIKIEHCNRGYASMLLRELQSTPDISAIVVYVSPIRHRNMDLDQLIGFYTKRGFLPIISEGAGEYTDMYWSAEPVDPRLMKTIRHIAGYFP